MTTADVRLIKCSNCGAVNRVPEEKIARALAPVCGRCKKPLRLDQAGEPLAIPITITDSNFGEQVERSALPVLIDMWAPWCGPCRAVGPVVEQIAREWWGRVRVAKLNVDDNPMTASRFNVQSIPTLLIMKGGKEIDRIVGAVPKTEIVRRLDRAVAGN